ncbi:hypothetical protein V8G54_013067 [Vigna mungo]|uniref:RanBP2-type domain-containing protein n=1 Tax=Vigna mungo TaxID=3915 RepID=A0AAQ3NUY7_VIGMU
MPPQFLCRNSSSSAAAETLPSVDHPWSEWVSFVDRLSAKGYLSKPPSSDNTVSLYTDMNSLKDACLSFGRDRYDLIKSVNFETDARTVDIVRILLYYALDPLVLSGGDKPSGREVIESSARKLLCQLIELSESPTPAPAPAVARSKPTARDPVEEGQSQSEIGCGVMNFASRMKCVRCQEPNPSPKKYPGDWGCPK